MIFLLIFILNLPKNLKVEILFLDNLLEDKQLNDDLRLNILKTLNKHSKIFWLFYIIKLYK